MNVKTLGINIAENVFQIAGMDEKGKIILVKRLSRQKLMEFVGNFLFSVFFFCDRVIPFSDCGS